MQNELNVQGLKKVYTAPLLSVHGDMASLTHNENEAGPGDVLFTVLNPSTGP